MAISGNVNIHSLNLNSFLVDLKRDTAAMQLSDIGAIIPKVNVAEQ